MQLKANSKTLLQRDSPPRECRSHLMRIEKLPQSLNTLGFWKKSLSCKTVHLIKGFHRQEWSFFSLIAQNDHCLSKAKTKSQKTADPRFCSLSGP
jgi:hypothetical protein